MKRSSKAREREIITRTYQASSSDLNDAYRAVCLAQEGFQRVAMRIFKPGSRWAYRHGTRLIGVQVVSCSGDRLLVRNEATGVEYRINAGRFISDAAFR